jgi:hypothetical protein
VLVFCDESWKQDGDGRKVGTLAAIAISRRAYNDIEDHVFFLIEKYFGYGAGRKMEIKGKDLLSRYEYDRERRGNEVSVKLNFARDLLESMRARELRAFATVTFQQEEVDLLCEDAEQLDRPYLFLMERVHAYLLELGADTYGSMTFDDRGLKINGQVAKAYRCFLTRSRLGRSFARLIRSPAFAYSHDSAGLQLADFLCTVVNWYHTDRNASPRVTTFYNLAKQMEWRAANPDPEGRTITGFKVIGGHR